MILFSNLLLQTRNDTSQIVNENLPQIQRKSEEMRQIYRRIDKLEVKLFQYQIVFLLLENAKCTHYMMVNIDGFV